MDGPNQQCPETATTIPSLPLTKNRQEWWHLTTSDYALTLKIRFGQARERKQLQWRESFNVFSGVGFRCGSKRGKKNVVSMVSHTFG